MLLFTGSSLGAEDWGGNSGWGERFSFDDAPGLSVDVGLSAGRHGVAVRSAGHEAVEVVAPAGLGAVSEPVSSFHLPPYYRWEAGGIECRFAAEWRDGGPSVVMSLRHMASLRSHPRALVIDQLERQHDPAETPSAAIVVGTATTVEHPTSGEPTAHVDWRGWHVVDGEDPFDGPVRRILATHTQVFAVTQR